MPHYTVLDTVDGGGSGGGTPGGASQIGFGNAGGTAFTSSADLTYDDATNTLLLSTAESGGSVDDVTTNSSNTASSDALKSVTVAGTSAGDAKYQAVVAGTTTWSWGVDNSIATPYVDPWKLSRNAALGTGDALGVTEEVCWFGGSDSGDIGHTGASLVLTAPRNDIPAAVLRTNTTASATEGTALMLAHRSSSASATVAQEFAPASGNSSLTTGNGGAKILATYTSSGDRYRFDLLTKLAGAYGIRLTINDLGVSLSARLQQKKGADVASGGTVTLGTDGDSFDITGTTAIDYITTTNWQAGSRVILQFDGSVTVNHNTGSVPANTAAIFLAGAANFAATAGDTLMLWYDGTVWREVARTVI